MPKKCGVYEIVVKSTGDRYIGSSVHLDGRFIKHRYHLKKGIHRIAELQAAYNSGGLSALEFNVIEECDKSVVRQREADLIMTEDCVNPYQHNVNNPLEISDHIKDIISRKNKGNQAKSVFVKYNDGNEEVFESYREVADRFKVSPSTVARWIKGQVTAYRKRGIIEITS